MQSKVIWIIAGEPSGDRYGALLAQALKKKMPSLCLSGMGGQQMREAGVDLLVDSSDLAVVGLVEVLRHYPRFRRVFRHLLDQADQDKPDLVVLIDYPGFNLRLAKQLHRRGVRVVYYVSPQVWAWGKRRIPKIARIVDRMLVIFPFEARTYAKTSLPTVFVGHPLVDIFHTETPPERDPELVLLLPGSRVGEVNRLLPSLLAAAKLLHSRCNGLRFLILAPNKRIAALDQSLLEQSELPADFPVRIEQGKNEPYMRRAIAGIAASGTVTVEAAILGLPLVVAYRVNPLTYIIGRMLVKLPFVTMVNLVAGRMVFEEFLQHRVQAPPLAEALARILPDGERRADVEQGMQDAVTALGGGGNAIEKAANEVLFCLNSSASTPDNKDCN